jgi:DNA helicase IV
VYLARCDLIWPRWGEVRAQFAEQAEKRCCDEQDDTILLNLVYAREGGYPVRDPEALAVLDHVVIDEAQDFGVMEVHALLAALDQDRTVTIVGDAGQKIVMNRAFAGWEDLLREAGFVGTTPIELAVSHRSTREVMEVAAYVRGERVLTEGQWRAVRQGPHARLIRADGYETEPHLIGQWIAQRLEENPHALSAVICRLPAQAEHLVAVLKKIGYPFVRWGHREHFDFSPGVTITNVHQVKGLEFRNVLLVNPTEPQYRPGSEEERNLLYVAVTRAEQRLDVICVGKPTPLLPQLAKG